MMEHEGAHVTKPLYSPYNIKIQVINRMLANAKYHSALLAYGVSDAFKPFITLHLRCILQTGEYGAMVSNMPGAHQDEIEKEELSPGEFCIQVYCGLWAMFCLSNLMLSWHGSMEGRRTNGRMVALQT